MASSGELAEALRELTHFLDGLWALPDPRAYMCEVIDRIQRAGTLADELRDLQAAQQTQHVLRRARIIIGRDRDVLWCDTPEAATAMVQERMADAYGKCGKELESLAAELSTVPTERDERGPINLSPAEEDLLDAIRGIGPDGDRSQRAIFDYLSTLGKLPSEGTTKNHLAAMKRHGILIEDGRGQYALPEWS